VNAYTTAGWENFFVAEVGASAALTGLLFVAVSINLTRILSFPDLPGRAAEALALLSGVLAASTLGLVPGQPRIWLGTELLVIAVLVWAITSVIQLRAPRTAHATRTRMVMRLVGTQFATIPFVVAAVALILGRWGGLYWFVPGTLLSFFAGIFDAWVLLIEIQR
jgi:hypothetical protein